MRRVPGGAGHARGGDRAVASLALWGIESLLALWKRRQRSALLGLWVLAGLLARLALRGMRCSRGTVPALWGAHHATEPSRGVREGHRP
jgi:hypothetical protein